MSKTILISGGAKGIGAAVARMAAQKKYNVVISYKESDEKAFNLINELSDLYHVELLCIKADITKEKDVKNLIERTISKFGKIDVLINNAALALDNDYKAKSIDEFMRVLEVNVGGIFLVTKYASDYMDNGIIVNISSTDAISTYNHLSMDYCASKAAVNNLTKTFAIALDKTKVLAVMLPWVNTEAIKEMNPTYLDSELKRIGQKRLLEPDEVALEVFAIIEDKNITSGKILEVKVK